MDAKTPIAITAREQTFRLCMVGGSEDAHQYVTKVDDRGCRTVILPHPRSRVFQEAGSDHPALVCAISRFFPGRVFLTPHYHAAVTSRTFSITFPVPA